VSPEEQASIIFVVAVAVLVVILRRWRWRWMRWTTTLIDLRLVSRASKVIGAVGGVAGAGETLRFLCTVINGMYGSKFIKCIVLYVL
jgi:hypothetical protein